MPATPPLGSPSSALQGAASLVKVVIHIQEDEFQDEGRPRSDLSELSETGVRSKSPVISSWMNGVKTQSPVE